MKFWTFLIIFLSLFLQRNSLQNNSSTDNSNWENQIRQSIQMSEYQFRKSVQEKEIYEITNRAKNLRASIEQNVFALSSRKDDWQVKYTLESFGRENITQKINKDFFVATNKLSNRLTLKNEKIEIQYTNNSKGIRQDFIVNQKPDGAGDLVLTLDIESPFELSATDSMLGHSQNKKLILAYENLKVFDHSGKTLKAKFKLTGHKLAIHVDDQFAQYPLVIDPLTTTPNWTQEQNQANASFGYTVAYVGDVNGDSFGDVLVGAPYFDNGFTDEGRVFLYYGSSSGLSATPGWSYSCGKTDCQLGYSLDGAGKVNNDTFFDFIIGAPNYTNGQNEEGAVFIFHGSASGPAATPNRILEPNIAGIHFGTSVSGNAKFNNDNFSDIAIGAPHYSVTHSNQGVVYVYHGSSSGISTTIRNTIVGSGATVHLGQTVKVLADINQDGYSELIASAPSDSNGQTNEGRIFLHLGTAAGLSNTVTWTGEGNSDSAYLGETITAADINHDGRTDLVVGAPRYSDTHNAQGAVYVYYSNGVSFSTTPDIAFYGTGTWEYFGGGLHCGDVNGDSFADIIIGSLYYSGASTDEGRVAIYYGTASGVESTPRWTKVGGSLEASFGQAIAVGDVNGDATPDMIVSAVYESNGQSYEGRVYSFHGSQRGLNTIYSQRFNFSQASSQYGFALNSAGDVNNDGYDDLIVGAYSYDNGQTNEGRAFLYLGSSAGVETTPAWSFESNQASAQLGIAVTGNCDFNGDGYGDVVIGANLYDNGQSNEGRVYIFHGSNTGLSSTPNLTLEANVASAQFGRAISCTGDVNNDGFSDLIVGAPNFKATLSNEGKVFLYKGSASGLSSTPFWTYVAGQATAYLGFAVSFAGDVNNDGFDEILVGAYAYDNTKTNEGAVYLFNGSSSTLSSTPNWSKFGGVASAQLGYSLTYAKKLNNDSYDDFIIGAPGYKSTLTAEGAVFIYYGTAAGPNATPLIATGKQTSANFGKTVASAGDVDGDGYDDIAISTPMYDNGQTNEGRVYIYLGSSVGISITSSWQAEANSASAQFGQSIAGDFDMNGDGYDDLVVGAPVYKINTTGDGAVFSYYGSAN